jgi:hypothetical protein
MWHVCKNVHDGIMDSCIMADNDLVAYQDNREIAHKVIFSWNYPFRPDIAVLGGRIGGRIQQTLRKKIHPV